MQIRPKIISRRIVHMNQDDTVVLHPSRSTQRVVLSSSGAQRAVQVNSIVVSPRHIDTSQRAVMIERRSPRVIEQAYESNCPELASFEAEEASSTVIVRKSKADSSFGKRLMRIVQARSSPVAVLPVQQEKVSYVSNCPAAVVHQMEQEKIEYVTNCPAVAVHQMQKKSASIIRVSNPFSDIHG